MTSLFLMMSVCFVVVAIDFSLTEKTLWKQDEQYYRGKAVKVSIDVLMRRRKDLNRFTRFEIMEINER